MTATQAHLRGRSFVLLVSVCLVCTLPYWRSLFLPLIDDSYTQIWLGRRYGPPDQLFHLWDDALYRCRATSIWLTHFTEWLFGASPFVFALQSILVHAANGLMIVALGRWERIGYRVSLTAALLWGLAERHHEAVIWYAALPEQLVFFFVLASFLCWLEWWQRKTQWAYFASVLLFLVSLISKESGVVLCGLCLLPVLFEARHWRRAVLAIAPFWLIAITYFLMNMAAKQNHLHWNDGTFHLGWQFPLVITNTVGRLFWIWGGAGLLMLFVWRKRFDWRFICFSVLWILVCLMPYSFLSYMPRVPSRHVYLASLGSAFLLSILVLEILKHRRTAVCLVTAFAAWNIGYIWFVKYQQFVDRADLTQQLKLRAEEVGRGAIEVHCFPRSPEIAETAIAMHLGLADGLVVAHQETNCGPIVVKRVFD